MSRTLVTASLLNSWLYIYEAPNHVREAEKDEVCLEDKQSEAMEKARDEFLLTLNRIHTPTTEAQQRGMDFEEETYKGNTPASPYVEGGAFQIAKSAVLHVSGKEIVLYGRLDCLKNGVIYDIKRVSRYEAGKYFRSAQHPAYLRLFENADRFTYLAYNGQSLFTETYWRDITKPIEGYISNFLGYLEANGLMKVYEDKWRAK